MPRSGTTVTFQAISAHEDFAWFSQVFAALPWLPAVSFLSRASDLAPGLRKANRRTDQGRQVLERARMGPSEAYSVWRRLCGDKFLFDFMLGLEATERERRAVERLVGKVTRYQGKQRFAAKLTGPARIEYLSSIFPDALFIHVIRDGRAVVRSLMNVEFWRDSWQMSRPAWENGLSDEQLERWRSSGRSSLALAALQWVAVIERARDEASAIAPQRYAEVRYEDFVTDPKQTIAAAIEFLGLQPSAQVDAYLRERVSLRNMNYQWRESFSDAEVGALGEIMGEWLDRFGYREDGSLELSSARLSRPFASPLT